MYILGIDPGQSGGLAFINSVVKERPIIYAVKKMTEKDIAEEIENLCVSRCFLERVHSMPRQGVSSTFKFGANYGFYRGLLTGLAIPFETVPPQTWQRYLRCLTGGDKNVTKSKAQELFPELKITHATADALLIAEYGRRITI